MSRTGPHANLVRPLLSRLRTDARWACYAFGTQRALQRNRRNICRSRCRQNKDRHFCRKKMPHSFRCWNVSLYQDLPKVLNGSGKSSLMAIALLRRPIETAGPIGQ